jgi:hypothetical protein
MSSRKLGTHQKLAYLLLSALAVISVAACQRRASAAAEQWAPSYLRMRLSAGEVRMQAAEGTEWATMGKETRFTLEERSRIVADAVEGAQLSLGDSSTLELDPGTILELRNPRTLPRLQVIVQDGGLLFSAQKPSYEFITSAGLVTLLSVPSLIRIEVHGETTRLSVEEGAATYQGETETLILPACREVYIQPGKEPDVTDLCSPATTAPLSPPTPTPPGPTPPTTPYATPSAASSATPSATPSPTPSATPPATPTLDLTPTPEETVPPPTPTPLPPTDTPVPPAKPKATKPPPTQPPPTQPPPTQPPPTESRPTAPPSTEPRPTAAPASSS